MTSSLFKRSLAVMMTTIAALVVGSYFMFGSGLRSMNAQDSTQASVCQHEGTLTNVTTYRELEVFARPNSLMSQVNHIAEGMLMVGECADSTAPNTTTRYIWVEKGNGTVGYVKYAELVAAMQPPATPTPVASVATVVPSIAAAQPTLSSVAANSCQPYTVTVGDNVAYSVGDLVSGVDESLWAIWSATFVANDNGTTRGHGRVIHYAQSTCGSQEYANFAMGGIVWNDHGTPSWTGTIPNTYPSGYTQRICGSAGYCSKSYIVGG